jgi:hypothetical protein
MRNDFDLIEGGAPPRLKGEFQERRNIRKVETQLLSSRRRYNRIGKRWTIIKVKASDTRSDISWKWQIMTLLSSASLFWYVFTLE